MKKILVLGTGGHAKSCIDVVEKQKEFEILGIVENAKSQKKKFMGYSILGNDKDLIKIKRKCRNIIRRRTTSQVGLGIVTRNHRCR